MQQSVKEALFTWKNLKSWRILMKACVEFLFGYCPLVWIFYSKTSNNCINHLHEGAIRVVCNNHSLNFENLLVIGNSVSLHQRNVRLLTIKMQS